MKLSIHVKIADKPMKSYRFSLRSAELFLRSGMWQSTIFSKHHPDLFLVLLHHKERLLPLVKETLTLLSDMPPMLLLDVETKQESLRIETVIS